MNGRWVCKKCHSWTSGEKNRCSYCGEPQPKTQEVVEAVDTIDENFTKTLHNIVEGLTPLQKKKLYRYFEDNVL